jgi:NAD-dependent SIR2 family protein deacetylase
MPACENCGGFVTDSYVRVFAPPELDTVRVCPNCEDKLREGAEVREAHSPRH